MHVRPERLAHAIDVCIDRNKFFPSIAEILENANAMPEPSLRALPEPKPNREDIDKNVAVLRDALAKKMNVRGDQ